MAKKTTGIPLKAGVTQTTKKVIAEILDDGQVGSEMNTAGLSRNEIEVFSRYKKMLMAGFTQQEITETLKIDQSLYFKFIKQIPEELRDEWKATKILSVENALYMSCHGFSKTIYEDVVDKEGITTTLAKEKYFPPNINAIKYYLNNTSSRDWKDRSELIVNGIENMPMSELEGKVKAILQAKKDRKIASLKQLEINKQGEEIDNYEEKDSKTKLKGEERKQSQREAKERKKKSGDS